jgi:hypothetical protein
MFVFTVELLSKRTRQPVFQIKNEKKIPLNFSDLCHLVEKNENFPPIMAEEFIRLIFK